MAAIVILSFYVGMLEGKRGGGSTVTLSCTDEVLKSLTIHAPLESIATLDAPVLPKASSTSATEGMFAGSKNGTKYYTPGCAGLDRIKPENIIWFKDAQDATLQGYTAAAC
jgi:hypothetical protein